MKYKFLKDLTSDIAFKAYGRTEKELFENSAKALFTIICNINKVKPKRCIKLNVTGENLEDLLFNFLQELIAKVDTEMMFFSKFKINKITEKTLECECYGEDISEKKGKTLVKAVTNYRFEIQKKEINGKKIFSATVTLDI